MHAAELAAEDTAPADPQVSKARVRHQRISDDALVSQIAWGRRRMAELGGFEADKNGEVAKIARRISQEARLDFSQRTLRRAQVPCSLGGARPSPAPRAAPP
jgi:hypothetical protein